MEEAFCIRIPEGIMYRFQTVDDLIQYVNMHIQQRRNVKPVYFKK